MYVENEFVVASSQISEIISQWTHFQEVFEIVVGEIIDKDFQFQQKQVVKLMDSCITLQKDEGEEDVDVDEAETMDIHNSTDVTSDVTL